MSHYSDSDHRRLEATIFPDHCVVESHQISDASRGLRRVPTTRVWRTEGLLGQGGFGEVYLQYQESDKDAKRALKVIPTKGAKLSLADCQRELMAMIEFAKPKVGIIELYVPLVFDFSTNYSYSIGMLQYLSTLLDGFKTTIPCMYLAMEYMPLGDLEQNIREIEQLPTSAGPPLSEEEVQEITRQILEGLKIMHAEGFAHRDLKPQNIFVVQKHPQWWVKLGDFGLSKKRTDGTAFRTHAGTQEYMAPELFYYVLELDTETSEYTNAIDLWSLGCIIHRVVTGRVPFPTMLSLRNYCIDQSTVPLNMPPAMVEAVRFVHELLMPHPAKRPVASVALESSWLTTSRHHF
jgi:serine/threonine protein kinase